MQDIAHIDSPPIAASAFDSAAQEMREQTRLSALDSLGILDTPQEESFDRITRLTKRALGVPMSTISLIDGHRQWFKSRQGVDACETERGPAFCNFAIREDQPLIITDALRDERFQTNPFVIGEPYIRSYAGMQLRTPDGQTIGTLCAIDTKAREFDTDDIATLRDLAAMVMSELELRQLAMHDSLTGVLARRAFRSEGTRAIALALRHKHSLSCVAFDLDHFKMVNDMHGHAVGDLVLSACADVCREGLREADIVGRIGGEEFAVLLPHTSRDDAMRVAEKLRVAFESIFVQSATGPVKISASFGVSALDRNVVDIDELLRRADSALYAAKAAGRNTCIAWQSTEAAQAAIVRRVFKAGQIVFNAGHSIMDCTVRGLSDNAASIDVYNSATVPERFKLAINADAMHRACRVEARREKHLDVVFE